MVVNSDPLTGEIESF